MAERGSRVGEGARGLLEESEDGCKEIVFVFIFCIFFFIFFFRPWFPRRWPAGRKGRAGALIPILCPFCAVVAGLFFFVFALPVGPLFVLPFLLIFLSSLSSSALHPLCPATTVSWALPKLLAAISGAAGRRERRRRADGSCDGGADPRGSDDDIERSIYMIRDSWPLWPDGICTERVGRRCR